MNIIEVIPNDNYTLYVKADDGLAGIFDVKPFLDSEAFAPLKDLDEFKKIQHGGYFVEWECGTDLSADTIQARWSPITQGVQPRASKVSLG